MPATLISDLWTPAIWVPGVDEAARSLPALITSGAVIQNPDLDAIASGPGTAANLPFFRDFTDAADVIQVQAQAATVNAITGANNIAPILNREYGIGVEALAAQVPTLPGQNDPVQAILNRLGVHRQKRAQAVLLNILRGLFHTASTPNAATGTLAAARFDAFLEAGASPASGQLMDRSKFVRALALLGELLDNVRGGVIWMHPVVRQALADADSTGFSTVKLSGQDMTIETYQGIPLRTSNLLSRAGATSGTVYDTYVLGAGTVGWGQMPQVGDEIGVASLQLDRVKSTNTTAIYDRTRQLLHINGTRFTGTPAGQSATNAELATNTNWALSFQSADRCGVVCIRTNG